jgi:hypothetical protein
MTGMTAVQLSQPACQCLHSLTIMLQCVYLNKTFTHCFRVSHIKRRIQIYDI